MIKTVTFAVLFGVTSATSAMSIGQCSSPRNMTKQLSLEGQRTIVPGIAFEGKQKVPMRITARSTDSSGYYLRGNGKSQLCVIAALTRVRPATIHDSRIDVCESTAKNADQAKACSDIKKALKGSLAHVVEAQSSASLPPTQVAGPVSVRFGFCRRPGSTTNVLCTTSQTVASEKMP